jgi:hypothetical protein
LRLKFGITLDEYTAMLEMQNGVCAICGGPPIPTKPGASASLGVDHDHATGKLRGLLCAACNRRIHPSDTAETFDAVAAYLRKYK